MKEKVLQRNVVTSLECKTTVHNLGQPHSKCTALKSTALKYANGSLRFGPQLLSKLSYLPTYLPTCFAALCPLLVWEWTGAQRTKPLFVCRIPQTFASCTLSSVSSSKRGPFLFCKHCCWLRCRDVLRKLPPPTPAVPRNVLSLGAPPLACLFPCASLFFLRYHLAQPCQVPRVQHYSLKSCA